MTLRNKLKALTAPCREVDAEIAKVFGVPETHFVGFTLPLRYTASLDDTIELVEREMPGADWATHRGSGDADMGRKGYSALIHQESADKTWHRHSLPAVPLLLALLDAKGMGDE